MSVHELDRATVAIPEATASLALELADIHTAKMSEAYERIKENLSGELAENTLTLEGIRETLRQHEQNFNLLSAFKQLLPRTDYSDNDTPFRVGTALDARRIQASAIWMSKYDFKGIDGKELNGSLPSNPQYVLGVKPALDESDSQELLIVSAKAGKDAQRAFLKISVSNETLRAYDQHVGRLLTTPFRPDQITSMYQESTDDLKLGKTTPGSVRVFNGTPSRFEPAGWFKRGGDVRPTAAELMGNGVIEAKIDDPVCLVRGLSNADMAEYGVYERMAHLVALFGIRDEYAAVLANPMPHDEETMQVYYDDWD